jgi:2-oxoglutarate ferredoxin oxidoreductase subunit beta
VGALRRFLRTALGKKGFALIEVLTPCPTYYGRYNQLGGAADMLTWLKKVAVPLRDYEKMSGFARQSVFWRGVLVDRESAGEEGAHGT